MHIPDLAAAVLRYVGQTFPVRVIVTVFTLQPLLEQPSQQLLAVSAHGGSRVRVHLERVRDAKRDLRQGPGASDARDGAGSGRGATPLAVAA